MRKLLAIILSFTLLFAVGIFSACATLEAATITATADGLSFAHEDAEKLEYKVDSGEWTEGNSVAFSQTVGEHTVTARVTKGNKTAESSYTYTTSAISLNLTATGATASWQAVGKSVSLKVGEGAYSVVTSASFTLTDSEFATIYVKVEGGWDESAKVLYVGDAITDSAVLLTVDGEVLATPVLTASATGITWAAVTDAVKYQVKVNEGNFADATQYSFATAVGTYVVKVKAIGNGLTTFDSAETTFTYEVKAVAVELTKTSDSVVGWTYTGLKLQSKIDDGEFADQAGSSYTATVSCTFTVNAVAGWDAENKILYVGIASDTCSLVVIVPVALTTPTLTPSATGITWAAVTDAVKYQVKVNEGEFADATEYVYATEVGTYTVKVKAIGNGVATLDSQEATFSYEVKAVAIELTKTTSSAVGWTYTGLKVQSKINSGEFADQTGNSYTATESCSFTVSAVAGWDAENKILYVGTAEDSCTLIVDATENLLVENANGKEALDLADAWVIKKYSNGWVDTTASIAVASSYDGTEAVKFSLWDNYTTFRYSIPYSLKDGYNAIAFDIKGDGIITLRLQVASSVTGVYATINLGTVSSEWTHNVISVSDANWRLNFSGAEVTFADAMTQMDMLSFDEILAQFDTINFIFYGEHASYISATVLMDNLYIQNIEETASVSEAIMYNIGLLYTAEVNKVVYRLDINESGETGTLASLNLETNISIAVDVEIDELAVTLKDTASSGAALTLNGTFANGGGSVKNCTATGTYADALNGAVFNRVYQVEDFENYTQTGVGYDANNTYESRNGLRADYYSDYWKDEEGSTSPLGGNKWYLMGSTDYLQLDTANDNNSLKLKASQSNSMRYLSMGLYDGTAKVIGQGNTFSFLMKTGGIDLSGKIIVRVVYTNVLTASTQTSSSLMASATLSSAPANADWTRYTVEIDPAKEVYGFIIIFNANYSGTAYVCIDDIEIYTADLYSEYVAPAPEIVYADLSLNFEEVTTDQTFTNSAWTQYQYAYDWFAMTTAMNSRSKDDSKVANMVASSGENRRFIYNESGTKLGMADKLSVKIGNYFSGAANVYYKIVVIDPSGTQTYIKGASGSDNSTYEILAPSTGLDLYEITFTATDVQAVMFIIKGTSGTQYVYIDDLILSYEGASVVTLNFEDGEGSETYANSSWTQYKYAMGWKTMSGQMRSRAKDGTRVVNMAVSTAVSRYIYNENGESLGVADYLSIKLGNYFSPTSTIYLKVVITDVDGNQVYVVGSEGSDNSTYVALAATTGLDLHEVSFNEIEVKSIMFVVKGASGGQYLYIDDLTLDYKNYANLALDFEEITSNADYTNPAWTYSGSGAIMRSRAIGETRVVNMYLSGTNNMTYAYNATGDILGLANYFSVDVSNHFSSKTAYYKLYLVDADGNTKYIVGDADNFYTFEITTGLVNVEFFFEPTEIQSIVFVAHGTSGDQYIYIDNLTLKYDATADTLLVGQYSGTNGAGEAITVTLSENYVASIDYKGAVTIPATYEINGTSITINANDDSVTYVGTLGEGTITYVSATGTYAAAVQNVNLTLVVE